MPDFYFQRKPELKKYCFEARDYYEKEFFQGSQKYNPKKGLSLRWFQGLYWVYEGYTTDKIADFFNVSRHTVTQQIIRTQGKVEQYLKLKEMGRL